MSAAKTDIILELRKELLAMQGFRSIRNQERVDPGLGPVMDSFPERSFPTAAVHELIAIGNEGHAAATGFLAGLMKGLQKKNGAFLWASLGRSLFPPALKGFGIDPDRVIFVDLKRHRDLCWVMEEALKCEALTAVIGEIRDIDFTTSRRLQLAVEQSKVTGFLLRKDPRNTGANACVSRWRIAPLASNNYEELPGVGFPNWKVELLKIRNGKPGSWEMGWMDGQFIHPVAIPVIAQERRRKTG